MRACAPRPSARAFFPGPASLPPPRACAPAGRNSATRPPREGGRARARGKGGGARAPVGSVWLPQRQFRRSRSRRGPARSSSPLPRPLPPGRMRRRSASVGFGCVVAAEHSCEARESEPGGEGWSLHGGEPEEPPPLPTPPPQPPPPPPRRPPPGADGLVRSRRGGTRTSGRRLTAQHGPGNQAPLGGQLTGECAGREDHRAFQTVSDTRPGAALASRAPLPALARCRPLPCAELVRGPGPDPRTGAGAARLPGRPSARVAALGLGGAGAAVVLCLPEEEEEAVARPPRRRRREGALALARRRWGRVLASRCPAPQPCPAPPARHGRLRSPADARKCLAPRAFRASGQVTQKQTSWWVMSEHLGTGKTLDSRDLSRKVPRLRDHRDVAVAQVLVLRGRAERGWCLKMSWCARFGPFSLPSASGRRPRRPVAAGASEAGPPQAVGSPPHAGVGSRGQGHRGRLRRVLFPSRPEFFHQWLGKGCKPFQIRRRIFFKKSKTAQDIFFLSVKCKNECCSQYVLLVHQHLALVSFVKCVRTVT